MLGIIAASAAGPSPSTLDGMVPPAVVGNVWLPEAVGELGSGPPAGVEPPQPHGALVAPP